MNFPKPEAPYVGHSDLHFETERGIRSPFAVGGCDRGEVVASAGRVTFRGMKVQVECPNVVRVGLVTKTFPWGVFGAVAAVAAVLVYANSPIPFTWRQPLPYVVVGILGAGALLYARERWVEVVYSQDGTERRAYFRREPLIPLLGNVRTRRLLEELRRAVARSDGEEVG